MTAKWPYKTRASEKGFTLIELLVVIAIIAILAALLLPALSRAKISALNAKCKSNMRQLSIALQMYVDESNAYPFAVHFPKREFWYESIAPYYSRNFQIMSCPSFGSDQPVTEAVKWLGPNFFLYRPNGSSPVNGVSYGYNGYGLRSTRSIYVDSVPTLGLSGSDPASAGGLSQPVNPDGIRSPASMIAMGDSMLAHVAESKTYSFLLALGDQQQPSPDRHNGGSNITFADGHVENLLNDDLVADTEASRRRWNNDDRPHLEISLEGY